MSLFRFADARGAPARERGAHRACRTDVGGQDRPNGAGPSPPITISRGPSRSTDTNADPAALQARLNAGDPDAQPVRADRPRSASDERATTGRARPATPPTRRSSRTAIRSDCPPARSSTSVTLGVERAASTASRPGAGSPRRATSAAIAASAGQPRPADHQPPRGRPRRDRRHLRQFNIEVENLSDFGTLTTFGYGLRWEPIEALDLAGHRHRGGWRAEHVSSSAIRCSSRPTPAPSISSRRNRGRHPDRRRQSGLDRRQPPRVRRSGEPSPDRRRAAGPAEPVVQRQLYRHPHRQSDRLLPDRHGRDRGRFPRPVRPRRRTAGCSRSTRARSISPARTARNCAGADLPEAVRPAAGGGPLGRARRTRPGAARGAGGGLGARRRGRGRRRRGRRPAAVAAGGRRGGFFGGGGAAAA